MMDAMRRAARILSITLLTAGLVILADVGLTLTWKEPVSAAYGSIKQSQAQNELDDISSSFQADNAGSGSGSGQTVAPEKEAARLAGAFADQLETGKAIGKIKIPSIGADYVLIQGTDESSLQKGPGHYPDTALPGQGRTIGIAGHRTTYLAPFNKIDKIADGNEIVLEMPYGTFTYEVTSHDIVDPGDVGIVDDVGHERLVLTACHPLYSAAQRYAIFAKLKRIDLS
jgi:sortase A